MLWTGPLSAVCSEFETETADPGSTSSIPTKSFNFVEIDNEIIFTFSFFC